MKKQLLPLFLLFISIGLSAQVNKSDVLQNLENKGSNKQLQDQTATLKSASRLFGAKDDLTTVILVIPSGSTVKVLGSDSTYYRVSYEDSEGYILKRHAVLDETPINTNQVDQQQQQQQLDPNDRQQDTRISRFTYLENKYGTRIAALLNAGKIWKGMSSDMVRDSWGNPQKIDKSYEGNLVKEQWIYKNTWLYIENNTLADWGPVGNQ
jgi:hypothetical protein